MAQTKRPSQAEKAAAQKKRSTSAATKNKSKTNSKSASKKPAATKTAPQKQPEKKVEGTKVPPRFFSAAAFLVLFVLFLTMLFTHEGVWINWFYNFILGMIGYVGFYISIPALLYLFIIHAFSAKRPVIMRTICLISFVLLAGSVSHLALDYRVESSLISELYTGGITGRTGGLLCGLVGHVSGSLLGVVFSYIVLVTAAVMTLLASMQITVLSLIRAFQDRPKADWETDEKRQERPEPASIVVNHIATKRIEYVENRRKRQEELRKERERVNIDIPLDDEPRKAPATPKKKVPVSPKAEKMLRQIDEIETPVSASENFVADTPVVEPAPAMFDIPSKQAKPTPVEDSETYSNMPPLDQNPMEEVLPVKPVDEQKHVVQPAAAEPVPGKVTARDAAASAAEVAEEIAQNEQVEKPIYCFPPIDLLNVSRGSSSDGTAEMRENTRRLNETLASFKIEAHIINVTRGPSVTRYEVELEKGVRLNKLTTVADDIALSLGASGVRIAAVPGRISVVGIEVPNQAVTTVSLRDVISSNEFNKAKSKSSFAVGKDIGGNCIVGNIAKLPHMLIAGTTGSGKSVCMNSIIISLLYKASPEDVKLIMVDPKMVELGIYNGIPHLLIPVVTDPKKAAGSLQWAVTEMMRRYKSMSDAGVRDLEAYNSIMEGEEDGHKLPQVVVIIDELADLMLVAAKEVEESICRIAQMGRAAGIHLIIATQRPSADVITGLMKANIPSRIAFAVASAMESRIILDTQGAEKLVGRGDMLFAPIGSGKPLRVQGCFVSDPEVEAVATYVKENYINHYDQEVMEEIERKAAQTGNSKSASAAAPEPSEEEMDGDEMLPVAVDVILETGQASVSMLQRRLKLGYARAARIVDEMEEKGIVGPFQGSKPRAILITKEQWEAMKGMQDAAYDNAETFDEGVPEDLY